MAEKVFTVCYRIAIYKNCALTSPPDSPPESVSLSSPPGPLAMPAQCTFTFVNDTHRKFQAKY